MFLHLGPRATPYVGLAAATVVAFALLYFGAATLTVVVTRALVAVGAGAHIAPLAGKSQVRAEQRRSLVAIGVFGLFAVLTVAALRAGWVDVTWSGSAVRVVAEIALLFLFNEAEITGDPTFRSWTPLKFPMWVSVNRDVPRDLYWHAIVNEYAHTHLRRLAQAA